MGAKMEQPNEKYQSTARQFEMQPKRFLPVAQSVHLHQALSLCSHSVTGNLLFVNINFFCEKSVDKGEK